MDENGPHRLIYLNILSQLVELFGKIRRCGFVGGDVPLGVDLEVSIAHDRPSVSLSACDLRVRCELLPSLLVPYLPG